MFFDNEEGWWKKFECGILRALQHPVALINNFVHLETVLCIAHNLEDRKVVKIDAPCPDAWRSCQSIGMAGLTRLLPRTKMTAIL